MGRLSIASFAVVWGVFAGCSPSDTAEVDPPADGVVFTYPVDNQLDVPTGTRLLISFSDGAASYRATVVGPDGPVTINTSVTGEGKTLAITSTEFRPGTKYQVFTGESNGPLLQFTTRNDRSIAGPPRLIAINGSDPLTPGTFRPIYETSTLQLVFSEPLDPRSTTDDAISLVDSVTGQKVPATLVAHGIHALIDPTEPLKAGAMYELRFGDLVDLGGEHASNTSFAFMPSNSIGRGQSKSTFRTWQDGDPNKNVARTDELNVMSLDHPLIGSAKTAMKPAVLDTLLGDPKILQGPVAFHIPKGQRLASAALEIALAGAIPSGLKTGDVIIELLSDGGGRMYRNRYRPADMLPDNQYSPLMVDLSFDLAVFSTDATGNAVVAQTIMGVQLGGVGVIDEGSLTIETLGAIDFNLLGMSQAPTNIVLDLMSDMDARTTADKKAPALQMSLPELDSRDLATDDGIELGFDEPIDIVSARAGGISLRDGANNVVPANLESHGSVVVVRPRNTLVGNTAYRVDLSGVKDVSGNAMPAVSLAINTQLLAATTVPPSLVSVYPGAPCALTADRCVGSKTTDDTYRPFAIAANEEISVVFDQPILASSLTLGRACNQGSVRVEHTDANGNCIEAVSGTLRVRQREVAFEPDGSWKAGANYTLRMVSGADATCSAGEICGANGKPANFDPLAGIGTGGGPDLVNRFVATAATTKTTLLASASPHADLNGSGTMETGEQRPDTNRVGLRVVGTSGVVTAASFPGADCDPATPEKEACMYILGTLPAQLGDKRANCTLPDGTNVASCVPLTMSAQAMYSTSLAMSTTALGFLPITANTGMSVMRMREPGNGSPLEGFVIERDGKPYVIASLELYMDAPDMSLPLPGTTHDMHSKSLSVALEGPMEFTPDGRISIALANKAEVPVNVGITAPLGITGQVKLMIPPGQMKLQLMSRAQRGSLP